MAIFTESVCLNWLNESSKSGLTFIDDKCKINDKNNCLSDPKIVKIVNKKWPECKKIRDEFVEDTIDNWYKDEDGNYDYGANTVKKVLAFAKLDVINLTKYQSGEISVTIWYNSNMCYKDADKFYGNHSLTLNFSIMPDYSTTKVEPRLEG